VFCFEFASAPGAIKIWERTLVSTRSNDIPAVQSGASWKFPAPAEYTFELKADDASRLFIDDKKVKEAVEKKVDLIEKKDLDQSQILEIALKKVLN
jgi:hypothetical protein